jgi:hypothetical protein
MSDPTILLSDVVIADRVRIVKALELSYATLVRSSRRESIPDAAAAYAREAKAVSDLLSSLSSTWSSK